MTYDEAVDKVAKLLRLSKSSNENEAALAASRAQEIMDRYKIDILGVDENNTENGKAPEPIIDNALGEELESGARLASWKWRLFVTIGKHNQCKGYKGFSGGIAIVGRPSDAKIVRQLFVWLVKEIDRVTHRHCPKGMGRVFVNNYRYGCTETVIERLEALRAENLAKMKAETGGNGMALMRIDNALIKMDKQLAAVQGFMDEELNLRKTTFRMSKDNLGRAMGQRDGNHVRLRPVVGELR